MTQIKCAQCGHEIELSEALTKDIEQSIIAAEHQKHAVELANVKAEISASAKKEADMEIEIAKKRMQSEIASSQKKAAAEQELMVQNLQAEASGAKETNKELRQQLTELMQNLREERKAKENAELEMQKKLSENESQIREEATKSADEKYRLKLAENEKKLSDTQKALDEAQRKAAQGSQQLQGEILELDMENAFKDAFREDDIEPIGKGVKGSDIRQVVKNNHGAGCGVMLWEIKRTKSWKDEWIGTIKSNLLDAKANTPIIITNIMPKHITEDIGFMNGVWICKPELAIVLASLLRKGLIDVHVQKTLGQDRDTKADALYSYVTSHEFVHQIESMVETYQEMAVQVTKERIAFEKYWALRDKQAQKLLMGTANIVGSMQGYLGQSSMPKIKGLELHDADEFEAGALEAGEEQTLL